MDLMALSVRFAATGDRDVLRSLSNVESAGKKVADSVRAATEPVRLMEKEFHDVAAAAKKASDAAAEMQRRGDVSRGAAAGRVFGYMQGIQRTTAAATTGFGGLATAAARAGEAMARTGVVAGEGARALLGNVAALGSVFGPHGILVSNIAMVGLAIYEMFDRSRKEMRRLTDAALEEQKRLKEGLDRQQNTGDVTGLMAEFRAIQQGTPAANFQDSIGAARQKLAGLREKQTGYLRSGYVFHASKLTPQIEAAAAAVAAMEARLADLQRRILNIGEAVAPRGLTGVPVSITARAPGAAPARTAETIAPMPLAPFTPSLDTTFHGMFVDVGANPMIAELAAMEAAAAAELDAISGRIATTFADSLKDSLAEGFASAFSGGGMGGLFESVTRGILRSLGQMFIEIGKQMVQFGAIMETIANAIRSALVFSGPAAIVGGLALIALGGALTGVAGGIGAGGRGGPAYRGGAGGGGYTGVPTQIMHTVPSIAPAGAAAGMSARGAVVVNVSAFGHFTPADTRQLAVNVQEAIDRRLVRVAGA